MIDPLNKMVAITVPYIDNDMKLLKDRISKAIQFMVDNGVENLDHKHAEFYGLLNE